MAIGPRWRAGMVVGLLVSWAAAPAWALPRFRILEPSPLKNRGAEVGTALLLEYYHGLPTPRDGERPEVWEVRMQAGLERFRKKTAARYHEGTLLRLLHSGEGEVRQAAVLALRWIGTMHSNEAIAEMLRDDDATVRHLAADTLWALWFRADSEANNRELQRLMRLQDRAKAIAGLDALIARAPHFAEAYNQRAIVYFKRGEFEKSIADCEQALKLNAHHFGAQSGLAQCYLQLDKPRAALKAFRHLSRIHPNMDGVDETIRALEDALGEEGKRDDKK
jgi:tetratricopeptide (TPR) repeat protein